MLNIRQFKSCFTVYTDEILLNADMEDVAFLVVGDPFGFVLYYSLYILQYIISSYSL